MLDLDELMSLHAAATPGPWEHKIDDAFTTIHTIEPSVASYVSPANAAYICGACNAVPELVARIRELEAQRDWMAQAAANAGWHGVRVGKEYMIDQARIAVSRAQAEQHECPTPEVSCHARDGKFCMSNNHLACAQAADKDSFIMHRFTEVK